MPIGTPVERGGYGNAPGATSFAVSVSSVTTGCHLVVAAAGSGSRVLTGVTDDASNVYTIHEAQAGVDPGTSFATCYAASAPTSVTVTFSGSSAGVRAVSVIEVTGLDTSSWFDVDVSATGTGTSASSGATATRAQNDEIVFGVFGASGSTTWTAGGSFNSLVERDTSAGGAHRELFVSYLIFSSTGTDAATATLGTSRNWAAIAGALKQAAVAGGSKPKTLLTLGVG